MVEPEERRAMLAFARGVIERAVRGGDTSRAAPTGIVERPFGGVFVTLRKLGRLRGCIGCLDVSRPFVEALRTAAEDAALRDPRFSRLAAGELPDVRIEVSILSAPQRTSDPLSLVPGVHGVLIRRGPRRGLFLPQVATDHGLSRVELLARCCTEKAGLPADAWRDPQTEVLLFTTEAMAEEG
ncbi:MAG: hypothetical protein CHACPFDD_01546 [Phycisphaerae bacterium]|nr:hypothetical protein [Phycisphaerae bacterium]